MFYYDQSCNTSLTLSLGTREFLKSQVSIDHQQKNPSDDQSFPSLTLGLSTIGSHCTKEVEGGHSSSILNQQVISSVSGVSSFSNSSVKRERDEEVEVEKVTTMKFKEDQDDECGSRKKLRLTKDQSLVLEESFKEQSTLNPKQKQALAKLLNLRPRQVEVWFQNRRARTKLKQNELDYELMKKCCETLTDENRRLHKEIEELKALKLKPASHMQFPAAAFTISPSCERISGGAVARNLPKSPFQLDIKPVYLSQLNHPYVCSLLGN